MPKFHLRPVMFHQTPLVRQISEAVRIERWWVDLILNSKAEFNRCRIGRLTIGEEPKKEERMEPIKETEQEEDRSVPLWEEGKAKDRRIKEVALTVDLERGVSRTIPRKRRGEEEKSRKNKAKLQYPLVGENWGEEETVILPMSLRTTPLSTTLQYPSLQPPSLPPPSRYLYSPLPRCQRPVQ